MPSLGDTSPSALGLFNHTQSTMDCTRPPLEDLHPMAVTSVHSPSNEFGDTDIVPLYNPAAPRTLVVCFDDTGEQFNSDESNVVRFFSLLKRDDTRQQMVYYQTGVKIDTGPQLLKPLVTAMSKMFYRAIAQDLYSRVMGGYEFLMQSYQLGDKICLFGFSRGACAARALAGMLHKVGLLPSYNQHQIPFAYMLYSRTDAQGQELSTAFKKTFSIDVSIEFVGVWDTVHSGSKTAHRLPFTASNTAIHTFRRARSLDESHTKFKPNHHQHLSRGKDGQDTPASDLLRFLTPGSAPSEQKESTEKEQECAETRSGRFMTAMGIIAKRHNSKNINGNKNTASSNATMNVNVSQSPPGDVIKTDVSNAAAFEYMVRMPAKAADETTSASGGGAKGRLWSGLRRALKRKRVTRQTEHAFDDPAVGSDETDVKEVWFAGCHRNGISVLNTTKPSLARISLRWMVRECFRTGTGIQFRTERLKQIGLDPAQLWPYAAPSVAFEPELPPLHLLPVVHESHILHCSQTPPEHESGHVDDLTWGALNALFVDEHVHMLDPLGQGHASPQSGHCEDSRQPTAVDENQDEKGSDEDEDEKWADAPRVAMWVLAGVAPSDLSPQTFHQGNVRMSEGKEGRVDEVREEQKDSMCPFEPDKVSHRWWRPIEVRPHHKQKHCAMLSQGGLTELGDKPHILVHRSVKLRMENKHLEGGPYMPRLTNWDEMDPVFID